MEDQSMDVRIEGTITYGETPYILNTSAPVQLCLAMIEQSLDPVGDEAYEFFTDLMRDVFGIEFRWLTVTRN